MKKEQMKVYQKQFSAFEATLNGASEGRVHQLRRDAMQRFVEQGFPAARDEDWRYTNLNPLTGTTFVPAFRPVADQSLRDQAAAQALPLTHAVTLLFVDGYFVPELSDLDAIPEGMTVRDLSAVIDEDPSLTDSVVTESGTLSRHPFTALNTAFTQQGISIHLRRGVIAEIPLRLLFHSTSGTQPHIAHPRIVVRLEERAECRIFEEYVADNSAVYFNNVVVDVHIAANAVLKHVRLQEESENAFHVSTVYAQIAQAGVYENHYFGLGASLLRSNLHGILQGEGAHCTMNGLFLPFGTQHMDHFTVIDHAVPRCTSHELYKGVLSDETRGVFTGRIIVRQDAQQTNAMQSNNNLLLSDTARVDTRPQLEIYADDVKCTHGATVGRISKEQLFYLLSRGINRQQAQNILTFAFAGELVSRIPDTTLSDLMHDRIHKRLEASWKTT
ncbi:MAG: Fe-S cluster assembly protein SufD [Bacteroidetes bacterium]|nr:Fe-S cluster assembly protein SufD [Bacteroidota bacterium]